MMFENGKISVVVIDDEPHVLEGLEDLIDWMAYKVTDIRFFSDVALAFDYIINTPVDIIITDVRMPRMTGITLIERVKSYKPSIEIIVMSGYKEFDYVQQVMSLGARNYLVKPIFEEDLLEVLVPTIDDVFRERYMNSYEQAYDDALLNGFINNEENLDPQQYTVLQSSVLDRYGKIGACMVGLWFDDNDHDLIYERILSIEPALYWLYEDETSYIILLSNEESDEVIKLCQAFSSIKSDKIGGINSLKFLKQTFEKYRMQLMLMHHYRQNSNFFFNEVQANNRSRKPLKSQVAETVEAIHRGDEEGVFSIFKELISELDSVNLSLSSYKKELIIYFSEVVIDVVTVTEQSDEILSKLPERISTISLETLITFIENKLYMMMKSAKMRREHHKDEFIHTIESYILENMSKQITIKELAEVMHMHPNYMGKKLKNELGESFSLYLNRIRINAAIRYLSHQSQMTIEEAAYKVGYASYPLFLKYFKMFNKLTPKAFLQAMKNHK